MSCGNVMATFRLLDAIVGWDPGPDPSDTQGLQGLDDLNGFTLARTDPGAVGGIDPYLPPSWLAPGCGPCEWYLAAQIESPGASGATALCHRSRLLRQDACSCGWSPVWPEACTALPDANISAIAAVGHRIAVADGNTGTITLLEDSGERVVATVSCAQVVAMSFDSSGTLMVAVATSALIKRFDRVGTPLSPFPTPLPQLPATGVRLGVGSGGWVWFAAPGSIPGTFKLWRARCSDARFASATLADLVASGPASHLTGTSQDTFCIERNLTDGTVVQCCYSRDGTYLPGARQPSPALPLYEPQGQLLSDAIDSGVPRCVWHRVRIDADVPIGTALTIAVATADSADATAQGQSDWPGFPAGVPHPADWQELTTGATDFLIQQPPGRYLYVRLRLTSSDGINTPRVRRVRIDFPRVTSLDRLPAIYRENPEAADFTERFLALFDASIADLDAAIDRAPALLDAGGVPDDVVPWLASFLGLVLDPAWEPARCRAILQALPQLYRQRGTVAGLKMAFQLVFDVEPAITELALERPWAALGHQSQLRAFRLFDRNRARAIIGSSALGATTIKSYGNPAADPLDAVAYRFRVSVPPSDSGTRSIARLQALLDSQKPAHTVATLQVGGEGFLLGSQSAVGIDTALTPLPAPVLGQSGNVRLGRSTVLRRGRAHRARAHGVAVGLQHLME
jgi:phage tail-like protein